MLNIKRIVIENKYARYKSVSGVFCFPSIEERAKLCNELDAAKIEYTLINRGYFCVLCIKDNYKGSL